MMKSRSTANVVHLLLVFLLINSLANHATAVVENTNNPFKPAVRTMPNGLYANDNKLRTVTRRTCEAYVRCGRAPN
ncbi:hypothetical protein BVRB_2g027940 [Beta vulgaris subsp. vulgaris]|nr:hypothetical protein BVRB_2g027940 [Beta vulgaris subsp. vulgaris]